VACLGMLYLWLSRAASLLTRPDWWRCGVMGRGQLPRRAAAVRVLFFGS
jgi:hypothetical protein